MTANNLSGYVLENLLPFDNCDPTKVVVPQTVKVGHIANLVSVYQNNVKFPTKKLSSTEKFVVILRRLAYPNPIAFASDGVITKSANAAADKHRVNKAKYENRHLVLNAPWLSGVISNSPSANEQLQQQLCDAGSKIAEDEIKLRAQEDEIVSLSHRLTIMTEKYRKANPLQSPRHLPAYADEEVLCISLAQKSPSHDLDKTLCVSPTQSPSHSQESDDPMSSGRTSPFSGVSEYIVPSLGVNAAAQRAALNVFRLSDIRNLTEINPRDIGRGSPHNYKLRRVMTKLTTVEHLSPRQANVAVKDLAKLFGYNISPPSEPVGYIWRNDIVFLAKYQAIDLLQRPEVMKSSITLGADATTKATSICHKSGFASFNLYTGCGSFTLTPCTLPDGTGFQMLLVFRNLIRNDIKDYYTARVMLGDDIDVAKSTTKLVQDLVTNIDAFAGDRGSSNITFVRGLEAWKMVILELRETSEIVDEAEEARRIAAKFDGLQKKTIVAGSAAVHQVHCTLHLISTFNGCYLEAADHVFNECMKNKQSTENLGPKYFSHTLASLFTALECRNDSSTSLGTHWHEHIREIGKATEENSMWKTLGHRQWAVQHNVAAAMYWLKVLIAFLENIEHGSPNKNVSFFLQFLRRPEVQSAMRIGALIHHFWFMPLLNKSTKLVGFDALQIHREFQLMLQKYSAMEDNATVSSFINDDFITRLNHVIPPNAREVAYSILNNADLSFSTDVLFLREAVAVLALKHSEGQSPVLKYFSAETTDEQRAEMRRKIVNAPFNTSSEELNFSILGKETERTHKQRIALTTCITQAVRNKTFQYVEQLTNEKEVAAVAAKMSKTMIQKWDALAKEHHKKQAERMRRNHEELQAIRDAEYVKNIEYLTSELQSCPGGLWRDAEAMELVENTEAFNKQLGISRTKFNEQQLFMYRLQVRFWQQIIVKRSNNNKTELLEPSKDFSKLTRAECRKYLLAVYEKYPASITVEEATVVGQKVEMEFIEEGQAETEKTLWHGYIVSKIPGDTTKKLYYVKFVYPKAEELLYMYDLEYEIQHDNVRNADAIRKLWE